MKRTLILSGFLVACILALVIFSKTSENAGSAPAQTFWQITAVDTVKYSRDPSRDPNIYTKIPMLVAEAAKLHVTHIAIDTPYDEEFYPVLKAWVEEARQKNLKVWFRGNFSGWEGWFGYTKFTSIAEHNTLTAEFISKHPDLFENGDIFTPLPEPENGGPGDPRGSDQKSADFNAMLVSSYNNCVSAFQNIHKDVNCGFFSTNGDIANDVITPETVQQTGNIITVDHYVKDAQLMREEIDRLTRKFPGAKIVLGEFGGPIPDINGDMSDSQQNDFITSLLDVLYKNRANILGVNYWTLAGGSTQLLNNNFSEKKVFQTVADFYLPSQISGKITDTLSNPLKGVTISDKSGNKLAVTNSNGNFSIAAEKNTIASLTINETDYAPSSQEIILADSSQKLRDIQLQPLHPGILYRIGLFFHHLF